MNYFNALVNNSTVANLEQKKRSIRSCNLNNPCLYVCTYSKYNDGCLSGEWVDLCEFDSFDEFNDYCCELHSDEADAEIMYLDYSNMPSSCYSESCLDSDTFDRITEYASMSSTEQSAYEAFCTYEDSDIQHFRDRYQGHYDNKKDFAFEIFNACYEIPDNLAYYIDYEAFANDIFLESYSYYDGYVFTIC